MEQMSSVVSVVSFVATMALWFVFAGIFLLRKKPEATTDAARAPRSWAGLALQGVGFGVVWAVPRTPFFSPLIDGQFSLNFIVQIIAVAIGGGSVWMAMSAVRELGKQWSLQARLVEGHKLVKTGVYQTVRHPIYTAMLGMLLATGIAYSHWIALLAGIVVFMIGTKIRTVSEERLLADAFGSEFTDWKAQVPALIPFVRT